VTFTATVTNSGGGPPAGAVEFFDGPTDLGPGTALAGGGPSATSTFTTQALAAGGHTIRAVYTPAGFFVGTTRTPTHTPPARPPRRAPLGARHVRPDDRPLVPAQQRQRRRPRRRPVRLRRRRLAPGRRRLGRRRHGDRGRGRPGHRHLVPAQREQRRRRRRG